MSELKVYSGKDIQDLIEIGDGTDVDYVNKQFVEKSEADKVIADLEESHKMEVEQLLMEIVGLKKLVETADKLLKQKGGFMIKDVTFKDVKLEGVKDEP